MGCRNSKPEIRDERTRSAQRGDIKSEVTAVTDTGHRGGSDYCTPTAKADTLLVARRRSIARTVPTSWKTSYTLAPEE